MKSTKIGLGLLAIFTFLMTYAQEDKVLMVINGDSINTSEFLRVYNKNLDLVKDSNQKELDNYLDLFIEYQLKLNEARRLSLDKDKAYLREFQNYKRQLTKSYLAESEVTTELVEEAYERLKSDVKAVHILVRLDENETDTLSTYNQVLSYRDQLQNESFDSIRAQLHNGKTIFAEDLGYFSAFRMVYSFENVAYKTPVGEVSMPFRTRFGYHILKVLDKRPSRGTITAAHIMVANEQKDSTIIPQERIQILYQKLEQGESFESVAKQFSDDKGSSKKGGELRPFKSGELSSPEFEDMVVSLEEDGMYSKPFQTRFGWHIVKRIKIEPLESFESAKPTLESRVKRDSRSKVINEALVSELKQRYDVYESPDAKSYFKDIFSPAYYQRKWSIPENFPSDKVMLSFNDKMYTYQEFGGYFADQQRNYFNSKLDFDVIYDNIYKSYFEVAIIKFREENLVNENSEFAAVLKEYQDGLLLFELMEREVWNKASKDTIALRTYYDTHKNQYQWNERVDILMASSSNKKVLKSIQRDSFSPDNIDSLKAEQSDVGSDVLFTSGVYDVNNDILPEDLEIADGSIAIYSHNDSYHLIRVMKVLPATAMTYEEAKGQVTNDYQQQLEKEWIADLKSKFPVWVDEDVFNELKTAN